MKEKSAKGELNEIKKIKFGMYLYYENQCTTARSYATIL